MSDDNEMFSNDDTVTITGSSSTYGAIPPSSGTMISSHTVPTITSLSGTGSTLYTVSGGGGGVGYQGGSGAIGHTGSYFTSTGTGHAWSTVSAPTKTIFKASNGEEISVEEIIDMMKIMKERLLVLIPAFEKHEKYAALKKAYDNYKMIEALIEEDRKDDK